MGNAGVETARVSFTAIHTDDLAASGRCHGSS
jgi:hypothetical protein